MMEQVYHGGDSLASMFKKISMRRKKLLHMAVISCIMILWELIIMIILAPSLLAADFSCLGRQLKEIEDGGAKYVHMDVMDGHFVPNISFGLPVVQSLRPHSGLIFDVHLMISNPKIYVADFARAGADIITVHTEALWHPDEVMDVIGAIRASGKKAGISIKPHTDVASLFPFVPYVDMILLMSVFPGFGGQKFIEKSLSRAHILRDFAIRTGAELDIQMDGGITMENVRDVVKAGVNVVVAGSAIFEAADIKAETARFIDVFSEEKLQNNVF